MMNPLIGCGDYQVCNMSSIDDDLLLKITVIIAGLIYAGSQTKFAEKIILYRDQPNMLARLICSSGASITEKLNDDRNTCQARYRSFLASFQQ